ncbi:MAG: hypothetical protein HYY18_06330 [Planctomycetes bacterium]|nr:hypothetical protein [Planctomycetota bacterium]
MSPGSRQRTGVTLIELLVLMLVFACAVLGAMRGSQIGAAHGILGQAAGLVLGFVTGLLAGIAVPLVVILPLEVAGMAWRACQPARTACTCGRTGAGLDADALLARLPGGAAGPGERDVRERREKGLLDGARVALAARLGHPACREAAPAPADGELAAALRSGLPPRLTLAWACGCAARALPVLESEFHEDRTCREVWEAARAALDDPGAETVARLESGPLFWPHAYAGCRVTFRPIWDRVFRRLTRGDNAVDAIHTLRATASVYCVPEGLWRTYEAHTMSDGYDNPEDRLRWAQPATRAECVAESAALAAADPKAECAWQRVFLAHLILGWETWDRDRAAWRSRVMDEWVPRVRRELTRARFDIPAYVDRIPRELVPWEPRTS